MSFWKPTATTKTLKSRANLFFSIRKFFHEREILEVETPILGKTGVTDAYIDCFEVDSAGETKYLQSSPEYFMKRLLASGSGSIYSLGKAFRAEEVGRYHQPEFTLLEWYRLDFNEHQLMKEVADLISSLGIDSEHQTIKYLDVFEKATSLNPHKAPLKDLQKLASVASNTDFFGEDRNNCLNLIFSVCIEPKLPRGLVFVYDYPECQSALAQLKKDPEGNHVARRFEAYLDQLELANGYVELNDPKEQMVRFSKDLIIREKLGKKIIPVDTDLLESMKFGLPVCAGVAIGVDRLLMKLLNLDQICEVIPFGSIGVNSTHE